MTGARAIADVVRESVLLSYTTDSHSPAYVGPYIARLRRNADGTIVDVAQSGWNDYRAFLWSDGDWACDCNRHEMFERVANPNYEGRIACGDAAYALLAFVFPDGSAWERER